MTDYAVNLNSVLTANCPQGITIDQFKKKIVNEELTLSNATQTNILAYAEPLKAYGTQFATAKNLTAITDVEKIFLSSFAPSTLVDSSGNLVESTTGGLTAVDMWNCAIETCTTDGCSPYGIVGGNKLDINVLTKTVTSKLSSHVGVLGIVLQIDSFSGCIKGKNKFTPEDFKFIGESHNSGLDELYNDIIAQNISEQDRQNYTQQQWITLILELMTNKINSSSIGNTVVGNQIIQGINTFINRTDVSNYYFSPETSSLIDNKTIIELLNQLKDIISFTSPENIEQEISNLETIISQQSFNSQIFYRTSINNKLSVINRNLSILYSATNVARYSFRYWNNDSNIDKWGNMNAKPKPKPAPWGVRHPILAGDITGAAGGATWSLWCNFVPAAGQAAFAATTIGYAVVGSVVGAVGYFLTN